MIGLSEMFHVVDRAVAADFGIPLIPYYQATKAYGGLQCDGIHFGKSSGELYGCTGYGSLFIIFGPFRTHLSLHRTHHATCPASVPMLIGC